ncbi:MAG: ATP-grasp domain-containing protein [Desulfarculaceae bacterium]|jgi:D-alanine-D-alanine ligase
MKVALLHDQVPSGAPPDQVDSLVQATEIAGILAGLGHGVVYIPFRGKPEDTECELDRVRPDIVFNLVESPLGKGRLIHLAPLLLERMGLTFTGAGTRAMLLSSNKLMAKRLMKEHGLPTPAWFNQGDCAELPVPAGRWIIKSIWEHASIGLDEDSVVPGLSTRELEQEMDKRRGRLGGECFAERFVEGREFNLSLLASDKGVQVLPPAEIIFQGYAQDKPKVVGYKAKWDSESYEYHHTPRKYDFPPRDRIMLQELTALSLRSWRLFGLRGWARVDFRVDGDGGPWILEINANPCLALDAGFMAAARQAGLEPAQVVARILTDGFECIGPKNQAA